MLKSRTPYRLSLAAGLVLALGLTSTAALFTGVRRLEHDKVELDFRQRANVRFLAIQQQLDKSVEVVKVLNQLFTVVEPVSREQFGVFTRPLLASHHYVQAFNFHRFVAAGQRAAFEAAMARHFPGFRIGQLQDGKRIEAPARPQHLVVEYLEPMRGNEAAFGLDVLVNARVLDAVGQAIDSGEPVATDLVRLAQRDGTLHGFLVVMPVYRHGMPLHDVASRRRAVIGDTAAVFDASDMIEQILSSNGLLNFDGIQLSVYASPTIDEGKLVFRKRVKDVREHGPEVPLLPHWLFHNHPDDIVHDLNIAGRQWRMVVSAAPGNITQGQTGALYVLVGGALLSLLAAVFVQLLWSRSNRVHRLVEQRTAELREANERLSEDIAARKRAEAGLQLRQRAIDASANAIIITGATAPQYPIEYVNPAFERITGYAVSEVLGKTCSILWADDVRQSGLKELFAATREQREGHGIVRCQAKDGTSIWSDIYLAPVRDAAGDVRHFVVALYDITATKRYQAELEFQANCDPLTGLANRSLLQDHLRQAAGYAERYARPVWVLFINLDRFKFVNDTLGHHAGDQLLKAVADQLRTAVRETDTLARLSADEFAVVLTERGDEVLSPAVVHRIMQAIAQPVRLEGHEFVMESSVGIAICPTDGLEPDTLIKHAGIAMYRAKETGRNQFQFYMPSMNERAMQRLQLEGELRNALERDEFVLHYQPQVDLHTGAMVGVEALIRWQHPTLGMVPPGKFIGLAEEMGLIVPIGGWVLRTACRQNMAWQRAGHAPVRVAVNLSARQFYQQDLVASIEAVLEETGIAPHLLELELTEGMMMNDVEHAVAILGRLKAIGVHLSIDDFGTGYSSLAYLKRFPIDLLKIDQSFVRDITVDPDDAAIVRSIISLARSLRLEVIAEGVETADQLAYLRQHGCDTVQGYYISKPVPAGECGQLLARRDRLLAEAEVLE